MVRRVTPAEFQRMVRDAARKQQQAINDYNRKAEQHNQRVRQSIERYNREARAHNARVVANQQRIRNELQRLASRPVTVRYEVFRTSVTSLDAAYNYLERRVADQESDVDDELVLALPAQENANSIAVMNALLEDGVLTDVLPPGLRQSELHDELSQISADFDARWRGALFALHPQNPDAARHFCTSAREIITGILDLRAPDAEVVRLNAACDRTQDGRVTRRAKIQFILDHRGIASSELGDFVDEDISNVLGLFEVFNSATHGQAGKYDMAKLVTVKKRVEGAISFLSRLAS